MIDASLRMNIVNLFLELKEQYKVSFVYITHDLSTAYYVSDYIGIMYRGSVVEYGPSEQILTAAAHPYTELLLDSVPTVDHKWERGIKLPDIELKEYQAQACKFASVANTSSRFASARSRPWYRSRRSGTRCATSRLTSTRTQTIRGTRPQGRPNESRSEDVAGQVRCQSGLLQWFTFKHGQYIALVEGEDAVYQRRELPGRKGKGGMSTDGVSWSAAQDLGQGWKVSPCIHLKANSVATLAEIDGPGAIQHIWITTSLSIGAA